MIYEFDQTYVIKEACLSLEVYSFYRDDFSCLTDVSNFFCQERGKNFYLYLNKDIITKRMHEHGRFTLAYHIYATLNEMIECGKVPDNFYILYENYQ